ncbi:hypothetical protein ACA910_003935 [Epithemia clementina (nom. ined.)]
MLTKTIGIKKLAAAALSLWVVASNHHRTWLEPTHANHLDGCEPPTSCANNGSCGNCRDERLDERGCNCPGCECAVCGTDPTCCDLSWNLDCVLVAEQMCACGGEESPQASVSPAAPSSSRPTPSTASRSVVPSIEESPSDVDSLCGDPKEECENGSCGTTCQLNRYPETGCDCPSCECTVCAFDSFCCQEGWDEQCVDEARQYCHCLLRTVTSSVIGSPSSSSPSNGRHMSAIPTTSLQPTRRTPTIMTLCREGACLEPNCGTCTEFRFEPGCSCEECECAVCAYDSWCCEFFWDSTCVSHANDFCDCPHHYSSPRSISPAPSSSLVPSTRPSVSAEPSVVSCGNRVQIPALCSEASCANCLQGREIGNVGCDCEACECVVCQQDPFCCHTAWDGECVNRARNLCDCAPPPPSIRPAPFGQPPSSSAEPSISCDENVPATCGDDSCGTCLERQDVGNPGCSCHACECVVCQADPYCCKTSWDTACVILALDSCDCPVLPTSSPAPSYSLATSGRHSVSAQPSMSQQPSLYICQGTGFCDEVNCGNCREIQIFGNVGCSCQECECVVCQADPYCCETDWDDECTRLAVENCDCPVPPTKSPAPSSSLVPSERPSVSVHPSVSQQPSLYICKYTGFCDEANCGNCLESQAFGNRGCSCQECECVVCQADRYCCQNNWDDECVRLATENCDCPVPPSTSPAPSSSLAPSGRLPSVSKQPSVSQQPALYICKYTGFCDEANCGNCLERQDTGNVGCSCQECECVVCQADSYCCQINWDSECVGLAMENCDCPVPPSTSPAPSSSLPPSGRPSVSARPSMSQQPSPSYE